MRCVRRWSFQVFRDNWFHGGLDQPFRDSRCGRDMSAIYPLMRRNCEQERAQKTPALFWLRRGWLPTEYRRKSHKCERDRNKMVWSSFLGTGVTKRNKKSTVAKYRDCACHCAFLEFFRQVVGQKTCSKVLRWSVGIEPTLKNILDKPKEDCKKSMQCAPTMRWKATRVEASRFRSVRNTKTCHQVSYVWS